MSRVWHKRGGLNKENRLSHKGLRDHNTLRWHSRHGYPMYFRDTKVRLGGSLTISRGVGRYYSEAVEVHQTGVEEINIRAIDVDVAHVVVGSEQVLHRHYIFTDPNYDGSDRYMPRLIGRFVHQHKGKGVRRGHYQEWQFSELHR